MPDIREVVGDTIAPPTRVSLDETIGDLDVSSAELFEFIEMNRDLPDLYDLAHWAWEYCFAHKGGRRGLPECSI